MYYLLEKYSNSYIDDDCEIRVHKNTVFFIKEKKELVLDENIHRIYKLKENTYVAIDSLNKPIFIKNEVIDSKYKNIFRVSGVYGGLIIYYKKQKPRLYGIFDYISNKFFFETEGSIGRDLFDSYVFGKKNRAITCREIYKGNVMWKTDLSQYGTYFKIGRGEKNIELDRFLGVFENQLLVFLTDNSFLSIDVQTGKENYRKHINNPFSEDQLHQPLWSAYWQLHKDKLIFYRRGWYVEYDLRKERINKKFDINESLKTDKLHDNAPQWIKEGNLLYYFVTGFGSFSLPTIVILDIETQQIIWKNVYDNPDISYRDFKKNDKSLFVLDSKNTLHVFDKQTNTLL